jgi:hypothetical protein
LEYYIPRIELWRQQKYSLQRQHETSLEDHTKKLAGKFRKVE